MFSFGRRDDQMSPHHNQQHLMSTKADKSAESKPFRTLLKQARKQPPNINRTRGGRSSDDAPLNIDEMNVNETKQGIEVSLDFFKTETREPPHTQRGEPVISIKEQIRQRQRVYRTQFSVSFPALQSSSHGDPDVTLDNWRPRDHQIPLPRKLYRRMNGEDDIGDLTYLCPLDPTAATMPSSDLVNAGGAAQLKITTSMRSFKHATWKKLEDDYRLREKQNLSSLGPRDTVDSKRNNNHR
jgi:hypothetical protein